MIDKLLQEILESEVPEYLHKMLEIEKKSELEKYCKNLIITQEALFKLITSSHKIGYLHQIKHIDFVPPHLKPTGKEKEALSSAKAGETLAGDAKKLVNKISQIFKERRLLSVHVFCNNTKWHLFYFDQDDMEERNNHWKHGPHIHFVNYLWPNLDINNLWKLFNKVESSAAGKLHIRYKDQYRTQE